MEESETKKPVVTPTVLQMEATECGAASLGIVLAYHRKYIPLDELREECAVSRDGSKASNILNAARRYGLTAKGFSKQPEMLRAMSHPVIVHWNFNHFLAVEGFKGDRVHLNDPASGRRTVTMHEFSQAFTGVVLTFEPGPEFKPGGEKPSVIRAVKKRIQGVESTILFLLLTSLALVIPGLVIPTLSRVFVDDVLVQGKEDWLRPLLLGMALTALVRTGLTWLKQKYLLRMYTKLAVVSSAKFLWHVLRLPIGFFLVRFGGEIGSRVALNDKVAGLLSGRLAESGLDLLMIVFYGALLFSYDVTLTIVGVAIAALNLLALRHLARRRSDESQRLQQEAGKLVGVSMGALQIIETLKAGGAESDFFSKWAGHWAKVQNSAQDLAMSTLLLSAVPSLLAAISTVAILTLGGLRVIDGTMTIGMLVAYQTLMASFLHPVNSVMDLGSTMQESQADMKRLDDVLEHQEAPRSAKIGSDGGVATKLAGYVEIEELTFGYVQHVPPLITGFSLSLAPGARVALVGGSGSGKSTISKVVAGLYEPWEGTVRFDGRSRSSWSQSLFNHSVAMVDQDISLFEGTIRENITLWDPSIPDASVIQAAKDAHIHDEIATRPNGYDGRVEEAGRNFSGGQRQRLEIARALVRNPTVLLLDEATSALDPKTEQIIDQNLRRRGCTCLIVAHRLSTIRDCDEIIVLDNGAVVERGTHRQLMEAKGHYAELMGTT